MKAGFMKQRVSKKKTGIDLLPPWARNAKARRKQILILAVAHVFVVLVGLVFFLGAWNRQIWSYTSELTARIAAFDTASVEVAERLCAARVEVVYIDKFLVDAIPVVFNGKWMDFILKAVPEGAVISRIDYGGNRFLIVGEAEDINVIEAHMADMSKFFSYVWLGWIMRREDGFYSYEVRSVVGESE